MHYFPQLFPQGASFLRCFTRNAFGKHRAKLHIALAIHALAGKKATEAWLVSWAFLGMGSDGLGGEEVTLCSCEEMTLCGAQCPQSTGEWQAGIQSSSLPTQSPAGLGLSQVTAQDPRHLGPLSRCLSKTRLFWFSLVFSVFSILLCFSLFYLPLCAPLFLFLPCYLSLFPCFSLFLTLSFPFWSAPVWPYLGLCLSLPVCVLVSVCLFLPHTWISFSASLSLCSLPTVSISINTLHHSVTYW